MRVAVGLGKFIGRGCAARVTARGAMRKAAPPHWRCAVTRRGVGRRWWRRVIHEQRRVDGDHGRHLLGLVCEYEREDDPKKEQEAAEYCAAASILLKPSRHANHIIVFMFSWLVVCRRIKRSKRQRIKAPPRGFWLSGMVLATKVWRAKRRRVRMRG